MNGLFYINLDRLPEQKLIQIAQKHEIYFENSSREELLQKLLQCKSLSRDANIVLQNRQELDFAETILEKDKIVLTFIEGYKINNWCIYSYLFTEQIE